MSLTHRPIPADRYDLVAGVQIHPDQIRFAGTVKEAFDTAEPRVDFHGLFEGDTAVGFYKIDHGYERTLQGRGLATQAVQGMAAYLQTLYPGYDAVWLTVNLANPIALRAYLRGGFKDTGDIRPEGSMGPQHILRMAF